MKKSVSYQIRVEQGTLLPEKYSQYHKRLGLKFDGKLNEEVYGLEQAIAHAKEVRAADHGLYNEYWRIVTMTIEKVTIITETIKAV